jgi:hypothetical protein
MTNRIIQSKGFGKTNYYIFNGVTGCKIPVLPMTIFLDINDPPPPLVLFINPTSFTHTLAKKVTPQKTRADSSTSGYVIQHAKDELDAMQVNGLTATMFDYKLGLCTSDTLSAAYDHFLKMLAYIDNNGVNYNDRYDLIIDSVGRVKIVYDGVSYYGCFDDFNYKLTASEPFNFSFSWNFTISSMWDSNSYGSF